VWRKFAASILAFAATVGSTGACAMSTPEPAPGPCRVADARKLPAEAGGADAICAAVQRAVAAKSPNLRYSAEVRVLSRSALAANLEADGRKLPELRFSVSDRELNRTSIGRFAESVATALAGTGVR
jgi:hypothetical protein